MGFALTLILSLLSFTSVSASGKGIALLRKGARKHHSTCIRRRLPGITIDDIEQEFPDIPADGTTFYDIESKSGLLEWTNDPKKDDSWESLKSPNNSLRLEFKKGIHGIWVRGDFHGQRGIAIISVDEKGK